jgi:hypothetical protein
MHIQGAYCNGGVAVLQFTVVVGLIRDAVFSTDVLHQAAALDLVQDLGDLRLAMSCLLLFVLLASIMQENSNRQWYDSKGGLHTD